MAPGKSVAVASKEPDNDSGVEVADSDDATAAFATWDADANIFKRLLKARAEARRMEKRGQHMDKSGKKVKYKYILGDDITQEGNRLFVAHGICPVPSVIKRKHVVLASGTYTSIKARLELVNVDNPEDRAETEAWGSGLDYSDKGDGKAYSYAVKNATAKALGLNTSDDIEEHDAEYKAAVPADESEEMSRKAFETWAKAYKAALENASDLPALRKAQRENKHMLTNEHLPPVTRDFFMDLFKSRERELKA